MPSSFFSRLKSRITGKGERDADTTGPPRDDSRHIYINGFSTTQSTSITSPPSPPPSNRVHTSKYTWWSFLPKNLWEQFQSFANIYFLVMVILQFFPEFTPPDTLPVVAGLPLFVIVTLTLIKDGFEDRARHKADNQVNNHHCWRLASR